MQFSSGTVAPTTGRRGCTLLGAALFVVGCGAAPAAGPGGAAPGAASGAPTHGTDGAAAPPPAAAEEPEASRTATGDAAPPHAPSDHTPPLGALEAYEQARPVFERYCASCHTTRAGKRAALGHFNMDGYPFGGHHAADIGAAIRKALGAAGAAATMPRGQVGAVQGEEFQAVLAWADAFDRERAQGKRPEAGHHDHEH